MLEQGLCQQIFALAHQSQQKNDKDSNYLLIDSIFLLSNIVADKNPLVLKNLLDSQIYPQVIVPLFKWSHCSDRLRIELAYCIGNVVLHAKFT